jgi:hypothetical protein
MGSFAAPGHPVLRHLAIVRAARDFGLQSDDLDALALRFSPASGSADELAEAASAALLERR